MLMVSKVGGDQWLGNIYVSKVGGDVSHGPNRLLRPWPPPQDDQEIPQEIFEKMAMKNGYYYMYI